MKANIMNNQKARMHLKELIKKESVKHCAACMEEMNRDFVTTSKYNAMFHTMHLLVVLHDEFGFGKKRLERLLGAYADADEAFKNDLEDGVAWTKILQRLEGIGLEFSDEDRETLKGLLERGIKNEVEGLELLDRDEILKLEPNIGKGVTCALYAKTGAIVCPYELCVAAVGNAMDNGAELKLNFKVEKIASII